MIDPKVTKVARRVICEILEGAAFVFTDELIDEVSITDWSAQGTTIQFHGNKSGELHMWAPPTFLALCAANMLGIDEDGDQAQQGSEDAAKEILNMIVGLFVTEYYGDEDVFNISIPENLQAEVLSQDIENENCVWVQAEDHSILFNFYLENNA